jgi:uncharacterized protein (TIRG00374 family)
MATGTEAFQPDAAPVTARRRRWWSARWFQVTISLVVVAAIFAYVFPKLADYGEVWETVRDMTALELTGLSVLALWNLFSYLPLLVAVQPGLRFREAAVGSLASTAISNTLPGGAALGIGVTVSMHRSWGYTGGEIALAGVVSGIWNNFVKLGLPVVALACLAATGGVGAGLTTAAIVGMLVLTAAVIAFAMLLRNERLARRIGLRSQRVVSTPMRWLHKQPPQHWDDAAARFRERTIGLLRGRALRITAATIGSHLSLYLVLLVALRDVGVSEDDVSWAKVLAAFAFVRLLSAVPVTPGGLGVVELGLTAALGTGLDDATQNRVAAAVLVYRFLTWFAPIPLGMVSWLFWRSNSSWRNNVQRRRAAART